MIAVLTLICVFAVTMLLTLSTGAAVYRKVQARVEESSAGRVGISYLSAKLHGGDSAGQAAAGTFGGVDAVYLYQELGGESYETILYVYDGWLRELFCERDGGLSPEDGETIAQAQSLTVTEENGLLSLTYVDGDGRTWETQVYLRSGGTLWM